MLAGSPVTSPLTTSNSTTARGFSAFRYSTDSALSAIRANGGRQDRRSVAVFSAEPGAPVWPMQLADLRAVARDRGSGTDGYPLVGTVPVVGRVHVRIERQLVELVG